LYLLHLLPNNIWLSDKQPRHTNSSQQEKHNLDNALPPVELFLGVDMARCQEHRDEHVQERWGRGRGYRPIYRPLVNDAYDKIAKYRLQEYHLWNKVGVDVDGALKLDVVGKLQA
jgi:hypothetical protein